MPAKKNYRSADASEGAAKAKAARKARATGQSATSSMDAASRRYKSSSFGEGTEYKRGKTNVNEYVGNVTGYDRMTGGTKTKASSKITTTGTERSTTRTRTSTSGYKPVDAKSAKAVARGKAAAGKIKNLNSKIGGRTK